jgi:hypothetical protein
MNELENSLPELDGNSFLPDSEAITICILAVNGWKLLHHQKNEGVGKRNFSQTFPDM